MPSEGASTTWALEEEEGVLIGGHIIPARGEEPAAGRCVAGLGSKVLRWHTTQQLEQGAGPAVCMRGKL